MKKFIVFCLVSFVFFVGSMSFAATYNAASQFDLTHNPASIGYWSYGYTGTLGGAFQLFTNGYSTGWGLQPTYYPDVEIAAGHLTLAPSSAGQYAIVRWVTPESGQYTIASTFTGFYNNYSYNGSYYSTNADIHLLYNSSSRFDSVVYGNSSDSFGTLLTLNAGDTIDFAVGYGPDQIYSFDRVILDATIASVPEPATMLLLGFGLIGLAGIRRKFKK